MEVYTRKEVLEKTLGGLERWPAENEEGMLTMMGGDFNARTRTGWDREST